MRVLAFVTLIALLGSAEANGAQLTVSWIDNSGGVATFSVERRLESGSTFAVMGSAPAGITSYVDSSVAQGSTYCYRVLAYDTSAVSAYSNEACGSPGTDVAINKTGTGTGTVTSTPSGAWITLVAMPDAGSVFVGWSGGICTGTGPCVFAGNIPVTVTANFTTMSAASSSLAALGLTYNGKLRDRVGPGNAALAADGALD